ncbi:hypothetical protein OJ996_25470 [Luteolibacter sp. GHJ8]|uniref:DUF883 domain-containing protein n=1 Tax=Luteolibacter rhizosphaerae TaxID=2989719 RepID=A0ABT3GBW5_9BACT|nr:hypothetical protein [Luteolibacter rhizosphaerae]MCW1916964.1 hypothetical protein [Luteolibacter rhizosphaerae]
MTSDLPPDPASDLPVSGNPQPASSSSLEGACHQLDRCCAQAIRRNPCAVVAAAFGTGILLGLVSGACGRR